MNTSVKISSSELQIGDVFFFSGYWVKFTGFYDIKVSNGHTYRMGMGTWDVDGSSLIPIHMFSIVEGREPLKVTKKIVK